MNSKIEKRRKRDITTNGYLRRDFNNKLRKKKILKYCEECKSEHDLTLHHGRPHSLILEETLTFLGLDYHTYWKEYTKKEKEIIRSVMILKQDNSKMFTLCDKCHVKVHQEKNEKYFEEDVLQFI